MLGGIDKIGMSNETVRERKMKMKMYFWDTDFGEMVKWILLVLCMLIFVAGVFVGLVYFDTPICQEKTENINLDSRWSFWGGCQVEIEPGRWIPLDNWYYVEKP